MSISRFLDIPIVCLLDLQNISKIQYILEEKKETFLNKTLYVLAHYLNEQDKKSFCHWARIRGFNVIWKDCGQEMIYEDLCLGKNLTPLEVSLSILPHLCQEKKVYIVKKNNICQLTLTTNNSFSYT